METMNQISDELLAAFLEGKTNSNETIRILKAIANDSDLVELVTDAYVMDEIDKITSQIGDDGYLQFGIDPVFTSEETLHSLSNPMTELHNDFDNESNIKQLWLEEEAVACCAAVSDDYALDSDDSIFDSEENIFDINERFSLPDNSLPLGTAFDFDSDFNFSIDDNFNCNNGLDSFNTHDIFNNDI